MWICRSIINVVNYSGVYHIMSTRPTFYTTVRSLFDKNFYLEQSLSIKCMLLTVSCNMTGYHQSNSMASVKHFHGLILKERNWLSLLICGHKRQNNNKN